MRIGAGALAAGAAAKVTLLNPTTVLAATTQAAAGDTIRFASIGTGVRGCELLKASLRVPGVECVAVSDLWEGRLTAAQETLKKQVATSRNYKEILDRKDVDAVIVSCTDHQHRRVAVDACAAGKDVYCEKPLSHTVDDGFAMVAAAQKIQPHHAGGEPACQFDSVREGARDLRVGQTRRGVLHPGLLGSQFCQWCMGLSDSSRE